MFLHLRMKQSRAVANRNDSALCRPADATAETYVVCYILKRSAFNKLLGPIEEVWKLEALRKVGETSLKLEKSILVEADRGMRV